ncbi:HNH endonuclease signature motif containing protein, partial [Actinomyces sp.]|uniref:HNH endonuclease signature motif containing protein n=1 Tax=Actinomyces sp. TaxID=29317 RepID=UPI0026DAC07B
SHDSRSSQSGLTQTIEHAHHIKPWAEDGATSLSNLTSLCQAHHRLKHTPGWSLTRQGDGALLWTTPTGARYRRGPDGAIILLPRKLGPRHLVMSAMRVPDTLATAVDDAVVSRLHHGLALAADFGRTDCSDRTDGPDCPGKSPQVTSRGPRPGQPPGAFETVPYPAALHELGLAPLLDEIPPF